MKYDLITTPPKKIIDYVGVTRGDTRETFVESLVQLLRKNAFNIKTNPIPLRWAEEAIAKANPAHYRIMIQRTPVNPREQLGVPQGPEELGTEHGIVYFERAPKNSN